MKTTKNKLIIEQVLPASNDGKNQDIKQRFLDKNLLCNVNTLVEYCLTKGFEDPESPVNFDDLENYYTPNTEKAIDDLLNLWSYREDELKQYANDQDTYKLRVETEGDFRVFLNSLDASEFEQICKDFDIEVETEPQEVFEWWAVSGYLYDKLREQGCVVIDTGLCKVWGRTTTGQAILLDDVISRICYDMGILEGQENAWQ
jgi:hypothetical protein